MIDISPYKDLRREFYKSYFEKALSYDKYREESNSPYWTKWERHEGLISLTGNNKQTVSDFKRKLNVLVLSGVWCGDCQRQGPMLYRIAKENPLIDLRFIESKSNPELQDELRINGAEKVPVAVFLSEDFLEIQRFGDRHLSYYRRTVEKSNAAYCETGIIDPEISELDSELTEWCETFERIQHILSLSPFLKKRYEK